MDIFELFLCLLKAGKGLRVTHIARSIAAKGNLNKKCQILNLHVEGNRFGRKNNQLEAEFDFVLKGYSIERKFNQTVPNFDFEHRG